MRAHVVIADWARYETGRTLEQALQFARRLWAAVQELAEACSDLIGLLERVLVLVCIPVIGPLRTARIHRRHVRDADRLRMFADDSPAFRAQIRPWRRAYPNHWLYAELEDRARGRS